MAEYLGLRCRTYDSTETGGSSYLVHVGHAAMAIATGRAHVALITLAGLPRNGGAQPGGGSGFSNAPEAEFENIWGSSVVGNYALAASRHMYEFGTTSEQLAEIKVAASLHAQHNPNAMRRDVVTVDDVLGSPMVADPLHRLDCCVITDGGGALVVVSPEVAAVARPAVRRRCSARARRSSTATTAASTSPTPARCGPGRRRSNEAGVTPADIDYVSIYDCFTITVLLDARGPRLLRQGRGRPLRHRRPPRRPARRLPFNTDGGGLCNNHPANRGGMTKMIEAVRQLRGEAHPAVQVPDCRLALAHGTGGALSTRMMSSTLILGVEDA